MARVPWPNELFSEYVKDYSSFAAPLMAKLQVGREDGKKVSKKAVLWNQTETENFDKLKHELAQKLTLFQPDFMKPCILRREASDLAIGAVPAQVIDGNEHPVGFYSNKLASSQLNWAESGKKRIPWWLPSLSGRVPLIFNQFW